MAGGAGRNVTKGCGGSYGGYVIAMGWFLELGMRHQTAFVLLCLCLYFVRTIFLMILGLETQSQGRYALAARTGG